MQQQSFILAALLLASCATEEGMKTESIAVSTAVCGSCGKNIQQAVFAVEGVKSADFDLEAKTIQISFVAAQTNLATLERAISDAGYDANATKRDPAAYEQLDACCKID